MRSIKEVLELWLMAIAIGLAITVCLVSISHAATVVTDKEGYIVIYGNIDMGDMAEFAQEAERALADKRRIIVGLNSNGGVTLEAVLIGGMIRQLGGSTAVPMGCVCTSACALIWIAGVQHITEVPITFHAPYEMIDGQAVPVKAEDRAPLRAYWKSMGMSDASFDQSMTKGPSEEYQIAGPGAPVEEITPAAETAPHTAVVSKPKPQKKAQKRKPHTLFDFLFGTRRHSTD